MGVGKESDTLKTRQCLPQHAMNTWGRGWICKDEADFGMGRKSFSY